MVAVPIPIGRTDRRKVRLSERRRATHMHVMGASGQGKSKFLEHCIREDILAGHGVCLIDPEGDLYESIVEWCASLRMHETMYRRRVHLFDPTNPGWRFRFNPLFVHPGEKPRHRVDNVIEALAQVWGGEDTQKTPAIRNTLRAIFTVLVARGYSLSEAFYLTTTADHDQVVAYLTRDISDPIVAEIWAGYRHMAKDATREHLTEFGGARRRFAELLGDAEIRETLGAYDDPIDFRACMDNGDIVLINLSPAAMGDDPARAFGALFVRELFYCASRRDPKTAGARPFYAYIDECGDYLTSDIESILARSRKRGLHVVLAHQWLEQLRSRGEAIYQGVMSVQNKVIFGGISDEDAVILADQLFRTEYDLEIPVAALTKPSVVGYRRTWLENWSESEGESESVAEGTTEGEATSDVTGASFSETVMPSHDEFGFPVSQNVVTTVSAESSVSGLIRSLTHSSTRVHVKSRSSSHGSSEALEPILSNLPGAVHSLENVRHMAVARLRDIPPRHAVVKGAATPSFDIETFDVTAPVVTDRMIANFTEAVLKRSPYTVPATDARLTLSDTQRQLFHDARSFAGGPEPHPLLGEGEDDDGLG
jgi:hypothetical protein